MEMFYVKPIVFCFDFIFKFVRFLSRALNPRKHFFVFVYCGLQCCQVLFFDIFLSILKKVLFLNQTIVFVVKILFPKIGQILYYLALAGIYDLLLLYFIDVALRIVEFFYVWALFI